MTVKIALIRGDGIGHDVISSALAVMEKALSLVGKPMPILDEIHAGASYYAAEGIDIEEGGEARAGQADAIFLGAIGFPSIRHQDGTDQWTGPSEARRRLTIAPVRFESHNRPARQARKTLRHHRQNPPPGHHQGQNS